MLSHPNGWGGLQQAKMRQAAVLAHLIPDTPEGRMRISFVTEGEASLHFAIERGLPDEVIGVSFMTHQTILSINSSITPLG